MENILGIDVSSYQGNIDWNKVVAEGWRFAILKVIRKDLQPDKQFENNWSGCVDADMPIQGVYNYTYATTVSKAKADAAAVLKVLGSDRHPFVWLDYEDKSLPHDRRAAEIINAYCDVTTAGGCKCGVYFGMSYYNSYLDDIMPYVKPEYRIGWEARYYNGYNQMTIKSTVNKSKVPTHFDGTLYGMQYSSSGKVAGITGNVDLNIWFVDVEAKEVAAAAPAGYTESDFIMDSRKIWGVGEYASAKEMLAKTVTVSTASNKNHAIVTPLERYFKSLGYYTGSVEADSGKRPAFGNGMRKATILYQTNIVKAIKRNQDGILSAKGNTWKTLYGA
ncbi:MAG: GH25 family lysozyme [Lachnospiraceae bacterium]|nr:GH25 family lysozyme [Lachnospiraceae bacterium]